MDKELKEYRHGLIDTQRKLNESYDKLLIGLSGGALALSITFLKDIIGSKEILYPQLLFISWGLFVLSLASILGEILFGIKAHKKAIKQTDEGSIYDQKVGGIASFLSTILHWIAAICLILGLLFISTFAFYNMGVNNVRKETNTKAESATTSKAITRPGTKAAN